MLGGKMLPPQMSTCHQGEYVEILLDPTFSITKILGQQKHNDIVFFGDLSRKEKKGLLLYEEAHSIATTTTTSTTN